MLWKRLLLSHNRKKKSTWQPFGIGNYVVKKLSLYGIMNVSVSESSVVFSMQTVPGLNRDIYAFPVRDSFGRIPIFGRDYTTSQTSPMSWDETHYLDRTPTTGTKVPPDGYPVIPDVVSVVDLPRTVVNYYRWWTDYKDDPISPEGLQQNGTYHSNSFYAYDGTPTTGSGPTLSPNYWQNGVPYYNPDYPIYVVRVAIGGQIGISSDGVQTPWGRLNFVPGTNSNKAKTEPGWLNVYTNVGYYTIPGESSYYVLQWYNRNAAMYVDVETREDDAPSVGIFQATDGGVTASPSSTASVASKFQEATQSYRTMTRVYSQWWSHSDHHNTADFNTDYSTEYFQSSKPTVTTTADKVSPTGSLVATTDASNLTDAFGTTLVATSATSLKGFDFFNNHFYTVNGTFSTLAKFNVGDALYFTCGDTVNFKGLTNKSSALATAFTVVPGSVSPNLIYTIDATKQLDLTAIPVMFGLAEVPTKLCLPRLWTHAEDSTFAVRDAYISKLQYVGLRNGVAWWQIVLHTAEGVVSPTATTKTWSSYTVRQASVTVVRKQTLAFLRVEKGEATVIPYWTATNTNTSSVGQIVDANLNPTGQYVSWYFPGQQSPLSVQSAPAVSTGAAPSGFVGMTAAIAAAFSATDIVTVTQKDVYANPEQGHEDDPVDLAVDMSHGTTGYTMTLDGLTTRTFVIPDSGGNRYVVPHAATLLVVGSTSGFASKDGGKTWRNVAVNTNGLVLITLKNIGSPLFRY